VLVGALLDRRAGNQARVVQLPQVMDCVRGLFDWTSGMAHEVAEYREIVDGVAKNIHNSDDSADGVPSNSPRWIAQLVNANQRLKGRLDEAEETLKKQSNELAAYVSAAQTDPLTGLPNRRVFNQELRRRFAEWRRHGTPFAILLVDVDNFKKLNDQFGHLVGDAVLQEIGRVMPGSLRESDIVTRYGGEEFAVILPSSNLAEAGRTAERLRLAVERAAFQHDGKTIGVTVSGGAAQVTADDTPESLIERADMALYAAKHAGRNMAHYHDGRRCIAITTPRYVEAASHLEAAALSQSSGPRFEEFSAICRDLRSRLVELASNEDDRP
jgi:diguanylate cyclase